MYTNDEIRNFKFNTDFSERVKKVKSHSIVYYDEAGNSVSEEEGVSCRIAEYDADGNVIQEVWGSYSPRKKHEK